MALLMPKASAIQSKSAVGKSRNTRTEYTMPGSKSSRFVDSTASKILNAVESTKRELLLPGMVYSVRVFRLLPTALFDWIADAFGINKAMKTFRGRRT